MDPGKHNKVSYVIGVENKHFFFLPQQMWLTFKRLFWGHIYTSYSTGLTLGARPPPPGCHQQKWNGSLTTSNWEHTEDLSQSHFEHKEATGKYVSGRLSSGQTTDVISVLSLHCHDIVCHEKNNPFFMCLSVWILLAGYCVLVGGFICHCITQ